MSNTLVTGLVNKFVCDQNGLWPVTVGLDLDRIDEIYRDDISLSDLLDGIVENSAKCVSGNQSRDVYDVFTVENNLHILHKYSAGSLICDVLEKIDDVSSNKRELSYGNSIYLLNRLVKEKADFKVDTSTRVFSVPAGDFLSTYCRYDTVFFTDENSKQLRSDTSLLFLYCDSNGNPFRPMRFLKCGFSQGGSRPLTYIDIHTAMILHESLHCRSQDGDLMFQLVWEHPLFCLVRCLVSDSYAGLLVYPFIDFLNHWISPVPMEFDLVEDWLGIGSSQIKSVPIRMCLCSVIMSPLPASLSLVAKLTALIGRLNVVEGKTGTLDMVSCKEETDPESSCQSHVLFNRLMRMIMEFWSYKYYQCFKDVPVMPEFVPSHYVTGPVLDKIGELL